jgi:hypothetical protein
MINFKNRIGEVLVTISAGESTKMSWRLRSVMHEYELCPKFFMIILKIVFEQTYLKSIFQANLLKLFLPKNGDEKRRRLIVDLERPSFTSELVECYS